MRIEPAGANVDMDVDGTSDTAHCNDGHKESMRDRFGCGARAPLRAIDCAAVRQQDIHATRSKHGRHTSTQANAAATQFAHSTNI